MTGLGINVISDSELKQNMSSLEEEEEEEELVLLQHQKEGHSIQRID